MPFSEPIAVGVMYFPPIDRQHESFVVSEIQLYAWRVAAPTQRTAVTDAPFGRCTATWVGQYLESPRIGWQDQAGLLVYPVSDIIEE